MSAPELNIPHLLLQGFCGTVTLMLFGSILAMTLGLLVALIRTDWLGARVKPLRWLACAWVDACRNIPLLCQVLLFYYAFQLGGFVSALLGLCTYTSAYVAEVFRSGFGAVPEAELREARLLGLSNLQTIRTVLLPRSLESVSPALGQQVMNLTKNTAIAYFVAVCDLTSIFEFLTSQTYRFLEFFIIVLLGYGLLCLGVILLFGMLERHCLRRYRTPAPVLALPNRRLCREVAG